MASKKQALTEEEKRFAEMSKPLFNRTLKACRAGSVYACRNQLAFLKSNENATPPDGLTYEQAIGAIQRAIKKYEFELIGK